MAGSSIDHLTPRSLAEGAAAIVATADLAAKIALAKLTAEAWRDNRLSLSRRTGMPMPDRPGRPPRPVLLPPRRMPKRSTEGEKGRFALMHALAHIELNAVDMTWDLIGRFHAESVPAAFFDDWVRVGYEEAAHFEMVTQRLGELGGSYGDLPAHDGLWQAAQATGHSLIARVAVVPLILEARGLDVSPALIASLTAAGDKASAAVIEVIYRDEKTHVACGSRWFRFLCEREGRPLEATFHRLVRENFRGPVKPPFNDAARSEAGLTPGFYKPLARLIGD
ncbi:MAG TPA: ferritin-like domain-containing protein [Hyphomicrobiaceae bacterium]|nr:ferritin-like domain-containing protein [Hyphomicrobiaceae bacterium]